MSGNLKNNSSHNGNNGGNSIFNKISSTIRMVINDNTKIFKIFLAFLILVFIVAKVKKFVTINRMDIAKNIFDSPDYTIPKKGDMPLKYYNKNYKKNKLLRLRDYYITASYKSYLSNSSSYSVPSVEIFKRVIEKGARFLHLDIYSSSKMPLDKHAYPVVRDSTLLPKVGKEIKLEEFFDVILSKGWDRTNGPILLLIDTHFEHYDITMTNNIADLIKKYFGNRIVNVKYSLINNSNINEIPMKLALNKIIIFGNETSPKFQGDIRELINGVIPINTEMSDFEYGNELNNHQPNLNRVYNYKSDSDEYSGILSLGSSGSRIVENAKKNLSLVRPTLRFTSATKYNPVADLFNIDLTSSTDHGIQLVAMNYQYFDDNMKKYIDFFKNGSYIVKPDKLRDIPKPSTVIEKQNPELSFAPSVHSVRNGWVSFRM